MRGGPSETQGFNPLTWPGDHPNCSTEGRWVFSPLRDSLLESPFHSSLLESGVKGEAMEEGLQEGSQSFLDK